jgi:hypothetical protein
MRSFFFSRQSRPAWGIPVRRGPPGGDRTADTGRPGAAFALGKMLPGGFWT